MSGEGWRQHRDPREEATIELSWIQRAWTGGDQEDSKTFQGTSLKLGLLAAPLSPWRLSVSLTAGGFAVRPGNGLELDFRAGYGEVVQSLVLTQSKPPLRHHCPWQILAGRGWWDT